MDISDLKDKKNALIDLDQTADILFKIIEENFTTPVEGGMKEALQELVEIDKVGSNEIPESLVANILVFNADAIFKFAESPIEKIFLNALNILAFPFQEVFVQFTHTFINVDTLKSNEAIKQQMLVLDLWKRYQKISYKNTIVSFLDMARESASLTDAKIDQMVFDLLIYYIAKRFGMYYVTLQPTIKNILQNGKSIRPDVLIWNPYDPTFKVLIECDGYAYHSNKASFSQDRARDRALHMKGYKVLRFSGADIVNDPVKVAEELHQYLVNQKVPAHASNKKQESE